MLSRCSGRGEIISAAAAADTSAVLDMSMVCDVTAELNVVGECEGDCASVIHSRGCARSSSAAVARPAASSALTAPRPDACPDACLLAVLLAALPARALIPHFRVVSSLLLLITHF
jgi:hypothetical protein